jgi:subtilisin family serine protease
MYSNSKELLKEASMAFLQLGLSAADIELNLGAPRGALLQVAIYRKGKARIRVEESTDPDGSPRKAVMDADSAIVRTSDPTGFKNHFPQASEWEIGRGVFAVHFPSFDDKIAAFGDSLDCLTNLRDFFAGHGFPSLQIGPNLYLDAPELKKGTSPLQASFGQWNMGPAANGGIERDEAHRISKGENVVVALIDSEVRRDHVAFSSANLLAQQEVIDPVAPTSNSPNWHGTACASMIIAQGNNSILGVAPGCRLLPIKLPFPPNIKHLYQGFKLAKENNASIVSASYAMDEFSTDFRTLIEISDQMLLVVAAGNRRFNLAVRPYYPASFRLPNIISVVGSNQEGGRIRDSNYATNDAAHLAAPGADVLACDNDNPSDYLPMTGTSIAAPHVAGVAALLRSIAPHATPDHIKNWILESVSVSRRLSRYCLMKGYLNAATAARRAKDFVSQNPPPG